METLGLASLTEEIPAPRAVAAIVSREEITDALDDKDARPELLLEIARRGGDGREERSMITMTWSRDDLEQLLERAATDNVVLTFDRDELSQAVGDVEAHGLREKALVFTVAVTGALGAGAIANAMPAGPDGGPVLQSSAATQVTDVSSTGGYAAPAAVPAAGDSMVTDASSGGGYTAPAAASESSTMLTDASSSGGYPAPAAASASDSTLTDASSGGGYTAPAAASESSTMLTDASSSGGFGPAEAESTGGGGFDVNAPSPTTDGLLAGGIALAIAGAAFASRRRPGAARPA